jgi:hypothetical protein
MIRFKLILLILIVLTTFQGFSQGDFKKAYIVNNNDTIHGFIDYTSPNSISTNCFFQKDSNSQIINYKPSDLKGFCFDGGKRFISKEVTYQDSTAIFFLEFLLKGVVNLYYCKYKNEDIYFIEKDSILYPLSNDEVVVRNNNSTYSHNSLKYIGVLKVLLNDANSLSGEIENTNLDFTPLIRLLKDYHNQTCSNESCIVYYKKENALNDTKWKIKYGVSMEYSFTKIKATSELIKRSISFSQQPNITQFIFYFANFDNFKTTEANTNFTTNSNCLFPAFFVNFNRNSSSSFQLELKYKYLKYSLLNFSEIEIPVMYNYDFRYYKKIKPFINVGFSNVLILGAHINGMYYKYDKLEGATFNTDHFEPIYSSHTDYINRQVPEMNGYHFELNLGCGVGYTLPNENTLKLEFRSQTPLEYTIDGVLDGSATYESKLSNSNLSISLSYIFK